MLDGVVILVVDDDPSLLGMYTARIKAEGAIVVQAKDGAEALEQMRTSKPNLVLLDIMMPNMNGFEVLKQIKIDPNIGDVPVIILSAINDDFKRREGLNLGAVEYIAKSEVLPVDVVNKIRAILDKVDETKT